MVSSGLSVMSEAEDLWMASGVGSPISLRANPQISNRAGRPSAAAHRR